MGVADLPALNACLNSLSAAFLVTGYTFIRRGRVRAHRNCMASALICSALFLVSYITYHSLAPGMTRFQGQGWIRPVYFGILISHTILATVIVPLVLTVVWRAIRRRFDAHRRLARWTLPLWLYVSVTGVVIYLLLYHIYPSR